MSLTGAHSRDWLYRTTLFNMQYLAMSGNLFQKTTESTKRIPHAEELKPLSTTSSNTMVVTLILQNDYGQTDYEASCTSRMWDTVSWSSTSTTRPTTTTTIRNCAVVLKQCVKQNLLFRPTLVMNAAWSITSKCPIAIWQYIIASSYATIYAMQGRLAYGLELGERDNKIG